MHINLLSCPCQHDEYVNTLEWLPTQFDPDTFVIELGTWSGTGARALGRLGHRVETYDPWPQPDLHLGHLLNVKHFPISAHDIPNEHLATADLIYLDIDPHDGPPEIAFYQKLKGSGFRGVLFCDDIAMNAGMKAFWDQVDLPKFTTGKRCHLTGMGFVLFSDDHTITPCE